MKKSKKRSLRDDLKELDIEYIDLGWRKVAILIVANLAGKASSSCYGSVDFDKCELQLDRDMVYSCEAYDLAKETFIHEIMHCMLEIIGLRGGDEGDEEIKTNNEELATFTSRGLMLLKNLNPKLFNCLFAGEEDAD